MSPNKVPTAEHLARLVEKVNRAVADGPPRMNRKARRTAAAIARKIRK